MGLALVRPVRTAQAAGRLMPSTHVVHDGLPEHEQRSSVDADDRITERAT